MKIHKQDNRGIKMAKKRDKNEIYNKLLSETKNLFKQNGYDGTSMRDIAAAAGVNVSLTYYYFPDGKYTIAKMMCDDFSRKCAKTMHDHLDDQDPLLYSLVFYRYILRELLDSKNDLDFYIETWMDADYISPPLFLFTYNAFQDMNRTEDYQFSEKLGIKSNGIWTALNKAKISGTIEISYEEIRDETDTARMLMMGLSYQEAREYIDLAEKQLAQIPVMHYTIL